MAGRLNGAAAGWVLTGPSKPLPAIRVLAGCGCRRLRHLKHERFSSWSSEAIAAALAAHLPSESRLILLPGTPRGEEVAAAIVLKEGDRTGEAAILAFCKERLADFKCPKKIYITATIPRTATGKIQRGALAKALAGS